MSLWDEIDKAIDDADTDDAVVIAASLIHRLKPDDLVALLAEDIEHRQRLRARGTEKAAFAGLFNGPGGRVEKLLGDGFRNLLASPVKLGDGTRGLTFGGLTILQHRQRMSMLASIRGGIDATIERHELAIVVIEEAGVACLNDLEEVAA